MAELASAIASWARPPFLLCWTLAGVFVQQLVLHLPFVRSTAGVSEDAPEQRGRERKFPTRESNKVTVMVTGWSSADFRNMCLHVHAIVAV